MAGVDVRNLTIPEQFESDRLVIRAPRLEDAPELNTAICETFEQLHAWMPWAQSVPTLAETEANLH